MIIFSLDALADDSHRRHLIEPTDNDDECFSSECNCPSWIPDYKAYNAAIDGDRLIEPVYDVFIHLLENRTFDEIQIWSDRCESLVSPTLYWMMKNDIPTGITMKMRPIGDDSPQEELFEEWLNEQCTDLVDHFKGKSKATQHGIQMVFSSHKPTIDMLRRRGVFVFDCNQGEV